MQHSKTASEHDTTTIVLDSRYSVLRVECLVYFSLVCLV